MRDIIIPSDVIKLLDQGAVLALSVSGGKDGQAMVKAVVKYMRSTGRTNEMFLIHADLGRMEWEQSITQCEKLAAELQLELHVVSRSTGGLMERLYQRLEKMQGTGKPFWPSQMNRYCTSDEKRGPIDKRLRKYDLVISVEGIRAQEGREREKKEVCSIRKQITSKLYNGIVQEYIGGRRLALTWNPIHEWLIEDVWASYGHDCEELEYRRAMYRDGDSVGALMGWWFHPAYVFGNERVSCRYCIPFGSVNDLQVAARHDHDGLGMELIAMEDTTGFTFRHGKSLSDIISPILNK